MRLKIIAGNLAIVVLLAIATFVMISRQLKTELVSRLDEGLPNDKTLFERSYKLSAEEFRDLVAERAAMDQLRGVFNALDETGRRTRAYEVAEDTQQWLADPARGGRGAPDIVVIADETGRALARNGAKNVMFGKALLPAIPALGNVLKTGRPVHDVWVEDQEKKVLQTAIAAVTGSSGAVLGALIVGYDLSNGVAAREGKLLRRDIAFLVSDRVYSASLQGGPTRSLNRVLFEDLKADTGAVLSGQSSSSRLWTATIDNVEYSGLVARLPMSPSLPVAFAVLGNRSEATAPASTANIVLIMMLLGMVMVTGYGFALGSGIVRSIEEIEEGVLAVINGRTDLRLETNSEELGGVAYRINQLLNMFTGTEEESSAGDEAGSTGEAWEASELGEKTNGQAQGSPQAAATSTSADDDVIDDPEVAAALDAEPEQDYGTRVYREYVSAKEALGENVSNIPQERFLQRLAGRAEALAKKHGCRTVRFQVQTRGNQVVLRPVLIR